MQNTKKESSLNYSLDLLGKGRLDNLNQRSSCIRDYFHDTEEKSKKDKVQYLKDYIFGSIEKSPLEDIQKDFEKTENEIDNKLEKLIKRFK